MSPCTRPEDALRRAVLCQLLQLCTSGDGTIPKKEVRRELELHVKDYLQDLHAQAIEEYPPVDGRWYTYAIFTEPGATTCHEMVGGIKINDALAMEPTRI